jgi:putative serine protease PepD
MSNPQPSGAPGSNGPWWIPATKNGKSNLITRSNAILLAFVAGLVGSIFGASSSGSLFGQSINLSRTSNSVERAPGSVADIAKRVIPSVVSIEAGSKNSGATGTGFVIESTGYILTNNHVIAKAVAARGAIEVTLNSGQKYAAKVIGQDASYDLAVIKIAATGLTALQFGDSDQVAVGDSVIAIGSPLGLSGTVTLGIISAKNRAVTAGDSGSENSFINALQTDAAINPGNSGGPLVDSTGSVIGVNSAIATLGTSFGSQSGSIGLGFAIPINQARKTADQLIKNGKATYPVLGVSIDMNFDGDGALISTLDNSVLPGGPAAKAGLKAGDVIIKFDERTITSAEELIVAIRAKSVGDKVELTYTRNGVSATATVVLNAGN